MVTPQSRGQGEPAAEPRSVELRDYALVIRRRWVIVLVAALLGAAAAFGYAHHKGYVYAATSQVVVEPVTQGPLNPAAEPSLQVNMPTEQAVAESAPVAQLAAGLLHRSVPKASTSASHLSVTVPTLSDVLQITWQASSPKAAQAGANAYASAYLIYRHQLLSSDITQLASTLRAQVTTLQRQVRSVTAQVAAAPAGSVQRQNLNATLTQLNGELRTASDTLASLPTYNAAGGKVIAAALPHSPAGLHRSIVVLLGALIGLLVGIVAAFVRDAFDDRLRDPAVLARELGAPTLAILPAGTERATRHDGARLTIVTSPESRAADAVRALRAVLTSVAAGKDLRSFIVVGLDNSVSGSRLAAELGVALAESGRPTLLVAAAIRDSALPRIFDVQAGAAGLTNVLVGQADPEAMTRHPKTAGGTTLPPAIARNLSLITNGPPLAQPLSVLDSEAMAGFLASLREEYDFVVLDSPAADSAADVLALARLADGVVAVASEARSRGRAARELRQQLGQVGGKLVGGIFVLRRLEGGRRSRHGRPDPEPAYASSAATRADAPPPGPASRDDIADQRDSATGAPRRPAQGPS
jgi:polysaccharide biosynthesis transport protein